MKKFIILVKKEIKELLTPQMLVPLVMVVLVFVFIGKVVGKEAAKTSQRSTVAILDLDKTPTSELVIATADKLANVNLYESSTEEQAVAQAKVKNDKILLVIPHGFEDGIANNKPVPLSAYSVLQSFSMAGSRAGQQLAVITTAVNEAISNILLIEKLGGNPQELKNPVAVQNFVLVGQNQAKTNPAAVMGLISSQTTFIPIVLFLVIVFASQMIATSIATEKENKTLETLLSAPVNRNAIVASKLVGAGLVALLTAGVYLLGMRNYMSGVTSGALGGAGAVADASVKLAVTQLGLVFGSFDYLLLGVSLFFGILAALSVAMILASFAEDAKSAQGIMAPLMVLIMIPYLLTLFLDINSLSSGLKWLIYAIPFSHPFLAAPNILLGQYSQVLWGVLYMAAFFVLFVYIASKLFSSDKILTMRLKLKKRV